MLRGLWDDGGMTSEQILELVRLLASADSPQTVVLDSTSSLWENFFQPGSKVMVRTVTHIDTGIVVACDGGAVVLSSAAWIADTGRWTQAIESGFAEGGEIEPYPADRHVIINLGSVIDATTIPDVPRSQR